MASRPDKKATKVCEITARLGDDRWRISGALDGLAVSKDGSKFIASSSDRVLAVFSSSSGNKLSEYRESARSLAALALVENKNLALWACHGQGVSVVDLTTNKLVRVIGQKDVRAVAISPDETTLVTGGDRTVHQYDLSSGKEKKKLSGHRSQVNHLCFLSTGDLVSAAGDGQIKVHSLQTGKAKLIGPPSKNYTTGFCTSPKSNRVIWAWFNTLYCWDVTLDTMLFEKNFNKQIFLLATDEDSQRVLLRTDNNLFLYHLEKKKTLWTKPVKQGSRFACFFHDSTRIVFSPHDSGAYAGCSFLEQCDAETGETLMASSGHQATITGLAFENNSTYVSSSGDSTIRRWVNHEQNAMIEFPEPIDSFSLHPVDSIAACATQWGKKVAIVDLKGGRFETIPQDRKCQQLAFSPDGSKLALGDGRNVDILQYPSKKELWRLEPHKYMVQCLAWSLDNLWLASGGQDGVVRVHDITSGKCVSASPEQQGNFVSHLAFSVDSKNVFYCHYHELLAWSVDDSSLVASTNLLGVISSIVVLNAENILVAHEAISSGAGGVTLVSWQKNKLTKQLSIQLQSDEQPTCLVVNSTCDRALVGTKNGIIYELSIDLP